MKHSRRALSGSLDLSATNRPATPSRVATLISVCLLFLVAVSMAGFLSSAYWVFDLFNHFRPNYLVASLLFCCLTWFFDRRYLWLAVTATGLNAAVLMSAYQKIDFVPDLATAHPNKDVITVVSANVHTSNDAYDKAIEVLTRDDPDIIALTEVDMRWLAALDRIEPFYPYKIVFPRSDNFGMAVFSKLPFQGVLDPFGPYGLPIGKLEFGAFRMAVVHPIVPMSQAYMRDNRAYIQAVGNFAKGTEKPIVIVGDVNSTVFSSAMRPLLTDGLQKVGSGLLSYTWPTFLPVLGLQLDPVLARGIPAARAQIMDGIGSDHYPVQARFALP